ncbi:secreted RxLR effector protein 161-like [Nicotiana sylvestris]|uniref:secreted RxLR effector protein 161-like n=1 Tax=Nicotiana sylvestris TaxID=4096 RepID=UPI00388C8E79
MTGSKNQFLSLEDLKGGNVSFGNGKKYENIRVVKEGTSKEIDTPIATSTELDIDEPGSSVDQKLYRRMIGSLLYLTASRPEIVFSIGLCARFQENPKKSHLTTVKRILRYLKGTTDLCLWYPKGSNFNLVGYANANYACFLVYRKRTLGMTHFLGSCLVSWATKKQNLVALSTIEAEYVVAASYCARLLWIKQQLMDFGIEVGCIPIICNNTSAISMTKNPVHHKRTKQ